MNRLTIPQITEQAARFEFFLQTGNLIKIAEVWLRLDPYQQHIYIRRVLWQCARVHHAYVHPLFLCQFYGQILVMRSFRDLINQQLKIINL